MKADKIVEKIVNSVGFSRIKSDQSSYYKEYRPNKKQIIIIRVSNHRTHLQTWANNYNVSKKIPSIKAIRGNGGVVPDKYKEKIFYSIVFEDRKTVGNLNAHSSRFFVRESVVKSAKVKEKDIDDIIAAITDIKNGNFDEKILGKITVLSPIS